MTEKENNLSEFESLIRNRRTVHDFEERAVSSSEITSAISLARWAPNHYRTEPWRFYLPSGEQIEAICKLNAEMVRGAKGEKVAEIKYRRWTAMPGWLVLCCPKSDDEIREREDYAACCCAAHNMSLVLWARGIGMKWTTGDITRERAFFEIIGADFNQEFVVGMFWYGYPKVVPDQQRRPVADILVEFSGSD
ncbi:MAG: nitroreductase [Pseudomonadota bacterium]